MNFLAKLAIMALLHLTTRVEHHTTPLNRWTHLSLRTLLSSISEAKVTAQNILMLTKTPSITESLIIDEVSELLNIIIGIPPTNFPHKGAQSDKQILETLTKLTEKVDKLSKQVNKPKKVTSNHKEPTKGLEASKHVFQLLTKSYAQAANTAPKNLPMSNSPPTSQNPKSPTQKRHIITNGHLLILIGALES